MLMRCVCVCEHSAVPPIRRQAAERSAEVPESVLGRKTRREQTDSEQAKRGGSNLTHICTMRTGQRGDFGQAERRPHGADGRDGPGALLGGQRVLWPHSHVTRTHSPHTSIPPTKNSFFFFIISLLFQFRNGVSICLWGDLSYLICVRWQVLWHWQASAQVGAMICRRVFRVLRCRPPTDDRRQRTRRDTDAKEMNKQTKNPTLSFFFHSTSIVKGESSDLPVARSFWSTARAYLAPCARISARECV